MPAMADATNQPHLSPHSAKAAGKGAHAIPEPAAAPAPKAPEPAAAEAASEPGTASLPGAGPGQQETSLQESFAAFQKKRAAALKKKKLRSEKAKAKTEARRREDPSFKTELRQKFLSRIRHYLDVPYSLRTVKQICEPGAPEFNAPLFLDCCGLIRQVLRDLADEFGFVVGPWNQAYLFETLHTAQLGSLPEM
eukprot:COSAG05_NODE_8776_length_672_cov_1.343805_1_plen_193_part_10